MNATKLDLVLAEVLARIISDYNIKAVLKFSSNSVKADTKLDLLTQQVETTTNVYFEIPSLALTSGGMTNISNFVQEDMLSLVFLRNEIDTNILNYVLKTLEFRYFTKIFFIIIGTVDTKELQVLFNWCWNHGMLDVLTLVSDSNKLLTYVKFPKFEIIDLHNGTELFPSKLTNLYGHPIKSPTQMDMPRVFKHVGEDGETEYGGYIVKLLFTFLQKHNATFREYQSEGVPFNKNNYVLMSLLENKTIDISIHISIKLSEYVEFSYPVITEDSCIVTPTSVLPRHYYFLLPFDAHLWIYIISGLFICFIIKIFINILRKRRPAFCLVFLDTIRYVLQQPPTRKEEFLPKLILTIDFLLLILTLVLSCLYQSQLTSLFTKLVENPPIDTFEDLERAKVKILFKNIAYDMSKKLNAFPDKYFKYFVRKESDIDSLEENLAKLNTKYGYLLVLDSKVFLDQQQKYAPRRLFHTSQLCYGAAHIGFSLQKYSPYVRILNRFILQTWQSGLLYKWTKDSFDECVKSGLLNYPLFKGDMFSAIIVKDFQFIWIIYLIGVTLSVIAFWAEFFGLPKLRTKGVKSTGPKE
ncbi:unnamed protein product [Hermetia illucens]|uniref:Ionotropic receptor n=1 Tax=Hermetia illucens TaxID=343691 RepID=A0A7R8YQ56_HERIL|nr:unnamed protein product [Hermetia illucens]